MTGGTDAPQSRGHRKREKTRRQLIAAGSRVLAEKGEGLTVSDVVAEADVSIGTFYNYFVDRDALLEVLAEQLALSLAVATAREDIPDPARRFALATARAIFRALEDPTWARVLLRLLSRPGAGVQLDRYLREDLAEGLAEGRFDTGSDDATLDQVSGLVIMTIRRIVEGQARPDAPQRAVERGLRALGIGPSEAAEVAADAVESCASARPSQPLEAMGSASPTSPSSMPRRRSPGR
ncbi:MAG: TetR/AcrR family transcriptional regulator [bacterium]|nr:TetR/AcrR family transcriptional regulator [bacterium]